MCFFEICKRFKNMRNIKGVRRYFEYIKFYKAKGRFYIYSFVSVDGVVTSVLFVVVAMLDGALS